MAEKSLFHQPRCLELQRIKLVNITVSFWNVVIPKKYLLEQHGIFLHCENSRSYKDFDYLKKKICDQRWSCARRFFLLFKTENIEISILSLPFWAFIDFQVLNAELTFSRNYNSFLNKDNDSSRQFASIPGVI